jgi:hypothetical protein
MARPPASLTDLDNILGEKGEMKEQAPEVPKAVKKAPKEYIFQMVGNFPVDAETKTIRYPQLSLSNSQMIWDEDTQKLRQARLLRGFGSIWQDEQKDLDANYVKRNPVQLTFSSGRMVVNAMNADVVKFLMGCSDFEGCKKPAQNRKTRYRLLDTEAAEQKEFDRKKKQRDAIDMAWKATMEDLMVHYAYLGGNLLNGDGEVKSEAGLRNDYIKHAEDRPDLFLSTVSNPVVKMHMLVKKAFEKTFIIYIDGQCLWADTKAYICQVPLSHQGKVADYLAELMLTNDGKALRGRLESMDK